MAVRDPTFERGSDGSWILVKWEGLLNGDEGAPVKFPEWADRTIHFFGTFGAGGTIVLDGSNNGTSYPAAPLGDPQGNPISKTLEDREAVSEGVLHTKPRVTNGDGTTNLSAFMFMRRQQQLRV